MASRLTRYIDLILVIRFVRSRMRLLVMSNLFPRPSSPWSGVFILEQVASLRALGIDARVLWGNNVEVWGGRSSRVFWSNNGSANVPAASFDYAVPPRTWHHCAGLSYGRAALAAVAQIRSDFAFDLVHAHTSWLDGYAASLVRRAFGTPVILTEHSGPFTTQVDNTFKRYGTARALAKADRILAVSEHMRSQVFHAFPFLATRGIEIVGNGFDPSLFPVCAPYCASGEIVALWIGSFTQIKQPLMMLRAFAAARHRVPALRLVIAGNGPMERDMRQLASNLDITSSVTWLGSLGRRQVAAAIGAATFLIVSSEAETFSMVTLEALASGRPVISTRCGGPESIIETPDLGMLVENTEAGLSNGIERMAIEFPRYEPELLGASARARFSNDVIAGKLAAIYQAAGHHELS